MKDNRLKERVIKDIREALINKNIIADCETPTAEGSAFVDATNEDLSVLFAQNFTRNGGTMYYCANEDDIQKRIQDIQKKYGDATIGCTSQNLTTFLNHLSIDNCQTCEPDKHYPLGATLCEALIAWQGSIVVSSNQGLGVNTPALPETTIILAFTSQVVADWEKANERLKSFYPEFPDTVMVTNPAGYTYRKGIQKLHLILIEDED